MFNFARPHKPAFMDEKTHKTELTRGLIHLMYELRDQLRQFIQKKFRENNVDLTYEMHQIMACLWKQDGINQQVLADTTLKDKASVTFLIDNLSKRELVTRKEDPNDRRSKLIFLTAKGKQLGKKVQPWLEEMFTTAGDGLDAKALRNMMSAVEKMRDNLNAG